MSTKIQDTFLGKDFLEIGRQYDGEDAVEAEVRVVGRSHGMDTINVLSRSDFLAAVATECNVRIVPADAIVIERGELPDVDLTWDKRAVMVDGIEYPIGASSSAEEYREIAGRALALADYLDAHPPVDEAQVEALTTSLVDASEYGVSWPDGEARVMARRLYLAGVRLEAN